MKEEYAFPYGDPDGEFPSSKGLTLKDYFAAKAMVALLSTKDGYGPNICPNAYAIANQMLRERRDQ